VPARLIDEQEIVSGTQQDEAPRRSASEKVTALAPLHFGAILFM
jgi:hypothetical protein